MVQDFDVPPVNLQTVARGTPAQFIQTQINQTVARRGAKPLLYYAFFDVPELTRGTSAVSTGLN